MRLFLQKNKQSIQIITILFISLFLNLYGNDFSIHYHADESKKVDFIIHNTQDFKHPILILHVVRLVNELFGFTDKSQIVVLGRVTTAFFGTAIVFLTYKFSKQILSTQFALGAALLTAVAPGIVIHSHYLKEDIAMTFTIFFAIYFYFKFVDKIISPGSINNQESYNDQKNLRLHVITLGLSIGLTCATKYQAIIIVFVFVVAPIFIRQLKNRIYYRGLFHALIISFPTFLLINYPIFFNIKNFVNGFLFELNHSVTGHNEISIYPLEHFFSFHLKNSLIPSLGLLPVILALCFMIYSLIRWKKSDWRNKFFIVYFFIYYLIIESSPLKPFPGFQRYVIPLIPVLSCLCMQAISYFKVFATNRLMAMGSYLVIFLVILVPSLDSIKLVYFLNRDTRAQTREMLMQISEPILAEGYTGAPNPGRSFASLDPLSEDQNICTLVASSFKYDRYLFAGKLRSQNPDIYEKEQIYLNLFEYPFVEISPAFKSFAYSNPDSTAKRVLDPPQNSKSLI